MLRAAIFGLEILIWKRGQAPFDHSNKVKGSRFEVGGGQVTRIAHGAERIASLELLEFLGLLSCY